MDVAEKLKLLRNASGLSQSQIADKLGISRTTYVKYESGASKPTRKLKEISALFDVSIDYLMDNSLENDTPTKSNIIKNAMPDLVSPDEQELIKKYRQLNADGKEEILSLIDFKLQMQNKRISITQNAVG